MQKFIRENPTLAFGLGLPLFIVLVFLVAAALPKLNAVPPQYAVLFTTNYYEGNKGLAIRVENHRPRVVYIGDSDYTNPLKLYIYDPQKDSVREIPIILPIEIKTKRCCTDGVFDKITPVAVPELEKLTIDRSSTAPDGYEFSAYNDAYSHDPFLSELFFSNRSYRSGIVLKKGSYKISIPAADAYYGNAKFIGWVIPQ